MGNKTIYVRDDKLWNRAKKLAGKEGLSAVIQEAIANFVEEKERDSKGFSAFRFEMGVSKGLDGWGTTDRIKFEGQELASRVMFAELGLDDLGGGSGDAYFTAYRTRGGKLVLTVATPESPAQIDYYSVHASLKSLADDQALRGADQVARAQFLDEVSKALGEDWAVWIE